MTWKLSLRVLLAEICLQPCPKRRFARKFAANFSKWMMLAPSAHVAELTVPILPENCFESCHSTLMILQVDEKASGACLTRPCLCEDLGACHFVGTLGCLVLKGHQKENHQFGDRKKRRTQIGHSNETPRNAFLGPPSSALSHFFLFLFFLGGGPNC